MADDEQPQNSDKLRRSLWFGPRENGGYRPQTWQGVIVAVAVILLSVVASSKGRVPPEALLAVSIIAILVFFRWSHRR